METRSRSKSSNKNKGSSESSSDEDGNIEVHKHERKSRHFSMDDDCKVSGKDVYGFKTPKRKGQMSEKASKFSASSQRTPTTDPNSTKRKTRSNIRQKVSHTSKISTEDIDDRTAQTPHSVRRRIKKRLVKMTANESDEDLDDNESSGSSSEEEDGDCDEQMKTDSSLPDGRKHSSRLLSKQKTNAEDYFTAHEQKIKTSDNTLARLQVPRLDREVLDEILKGQPQTHEKQCKKMLALHKRHFYKWIFQMSQGFNLLLYGMGSKISILEEFREWLLSTMNTLAPENVVLVVNGFFPTITVKNILNSVTEDILEHVGEFASVDDQLNFIKKILPKQFTGCQLYLLVNNIDGLTLKNEKSQSVLADLVQIHGIHMVATIDHINAPLLWDQEKLSNFNWLWYDVTSYLPYQEETSYENSLLVRQSGSLALTSVTHVFESLTPNAKGIFLLIADYQLEHKDQTHFTGMAFHDCYQKCREAFLVNSELTLKAQLTEFKDHKLIRVKKGVDGGEYLQILLDAATLEEFKNQQKNGDD